MWLALHRWTSGDRARNEPWMALVQAFSQSSRSLDGNRDVGVPPRISLPTWSEIQISKSPALVPLSCFVARPQRSLSRCDLFLDFIQRRPPAAFGIQYRSGKNRHRATQRRGRISGCIIDKHTLTRSQLRSNIRTRQDHDTWTRPGLCRLKCADPDPRNWSVCSAHRARPLPCRRTCTTSNVM